LSCKKNIELVNTLGVDFAKIDSFLDDLPPKLKIQLSLKIYMSRYQKVKYLNTKTNSFITWICPILKLCYFDESQYIYQEGEEVENIYFMLNGEANYVLTRYANTAYIHIDEGDQFGAIDIICGSYGDFDPLNWMEQRSKFLRQFTTMAFKMSETLTMNIEDLSKLQKEFNTEYNLLFSESKKDLKNALILKQKASNKCEDQLTKSIMRGAKVDNCTKEDNANAHSHSHAHSLNL